MKLKSIVWWSLAAAAITPTVAVYLTRTRSGGIVPEKAAYHLSQILATIEESGPPRYRIDEEDAGKLTVLLSEGKSPPVRIDLRKASNRNDFLRPACERELGRKAIRRKKRLLKGKTSEKPMDSDEPEVTILLHLEEIRKIEAEERKRTRKE